ncbi:MAG: glycosyltransferase family 2 protein [Infirmifilum sp.]
MQIGNVNPLVSVIIVNYKSYEPLRSCIKSLLESDYPNLEIIVVDCLTPKLQERIRNEFGDKRIRIVHFDVNIGASASHNIGALASDPSAKYLVFMDNDVIVSSNALRMLVEAMEKNPFMGVVQAKVISRSNEGKMDHMSLGLDVAGTWVTTYGQSAELFSRPLEIFLASSAMMITRRDLYFEALGFDDTYFIYDDDTDYSWRVRLLGYSVGYEPSAVVYHEDKFENRLRYDKLYFGFKNRLLNIFKNLEAENMVFSVVFTLYLGYINIVLLSLGLKGKEALAYFKASINILNTLPTRLLHRKIIQRRRKVPDRIFFEKGFLRKDLFGTIVMLRELLIRYYKSFKENTGKTTHI